MQQAIHSERLDRWLGPGQAEHISRSMRGWYSDPIAVANAPGRVLARADGDFVGKLSDGGRWSSLADRTIERTIQWCERVWRHQGGHLNAGVTSLDGLIAAATAGQTQTYQFNKAGPTGVVNVSSSLWGVGNTPAAGAAASGAAPGGTVNTSATTGAFPLFNVSPAFQSYTTGWASGSIIANTLLIYDRIFSVTKTMSSSATEAVSGVPTRYTNTTAGTADYIGGNFLFVETGAALAAVAHNWTTCLYNNQANAGSTLPSLTGNSSGIIWRLDHPAGHWFAPLATGDSGVKALTQMQCSSASVTGTINFVIGHPIAFIPCPVANQVCVGDGVYSAFNLARIFDNACLALMEVTKPATNATTYTGQFQGVYA